MKPAGFLAEKTITENSIYILYFVKQIFECYDMINIYRSMKIHHQIMMIDITVTHEISKNLFVYDYFGLSSCWE